MDAVVSDSTTKSIGTGGDEEAQQTINSTRDILQKKQVREKKGKTTAETKHDMQNINAIVELLQREIRDLQDRMLDCEDKSHSYYGGISSSTTATNNLKTHMVCKIECLNFKRSLTVWKKPTEP